MAEGKNMDNETALNEAKKYGDRLSYIALMIVQITLFVLKMSGVIDWDWYLVFLPILIPVCILVILVILGLIAIAINSRKNKT